MANVVWTVTVSTSTKTWDQVLAAVLVNGTIPLKMPGPATQFHLIDGKNLATFHGNFFVNGSGVIQSGTITGFDLYYDGPAGHVLNATGHAMDAAAFTQALAAFQASSSFAIEALLFGEPMTFHGGPRGDEFGGGHSADLVNGNGNHDNLGGGEGNDRLFGGEGYDTLSGDDGDDTLFGGEGVDHLGGGSGFDTADYATEANYISVTLNGPTIVDLLIGGAVADHLVDVENVVGGIGNDNLIGDGFNNEFVGNAGDDKLTGNDGSDDLSGGDGNDKVDGGEGNDRLAGGLGNDRLVGGKASDTLVFDTALHAKNNVDKVKKFSHAKDTVELDQAVFTELDLGALKGKHFRLGEKAKDGNDRVIYDEDSGVLAYDADGRGGLKQVAFAKLKGAPDIAADDFLVV